MNFVSQKYFRKALKRMASGMNLPGTMLPKAGRDPLTGLTDFASVPGLLRAWEEQGEAIGETPNIHALLLGIRRFDAVNLAYGAAAGDAALVEIAARISLFAEAELDCPCVIARGNGGNFLVVADEACSRERWGLFADQLADVVSRPITAASGALRLSPRLALLRGVGGESSESILDRLGQALANAQRLEGRRLLWADGEPTKPGRTAAQLEADLLMAIDTDAIEIRYQPQYSLESGAIIAAEALARWNHPDLGRIGAAALFAIAERADHVAPLSRHIARLALADAARWPEPMRLSLNITPSDLAAASFAEEFGALVADSGFAPGRLTLELTEQVLLADVQLAQRSLEMLVAQGIRVALDDFGAGFCNFRYLKLLPLHYLKLDRSMVAGITSSERDLAVLRAMMAMAQALDLEVIAEGIENEAQRAIVAREGCKAFQGFLKSEPMTATELSALL